MVTVICPSSGFDVLSVTVHSLRAGGSAEPVLRHALPLFRPQLHHDLHQPHCVRQLFSVFCRVQHSYTPSG